jgi:hypothetical protein
VEYHLSCFIDGERVEGLVKAKTSTQIDVDQQIAALEVLGYTVDRITVTLQNKKGAVAQVGMEVVA